jgi:chromate transporter
VSLGVLYLLLLKATLTSFSGMGGLAQIRQDLVVTHAVLTDDELSRAVLFGRSTPGPIGVYVVSVGYSVRGRVRGAVDAVVIAGGTLLVPSGLLLARDAIRQLASLWGG